LSINSVVSSINNYNKQNSTFGRYGTMANKNFVVHNGLTVGPLTIDAATGDISTPGNVTVTGDLGVSQIQKNDSSISINDTGSSSTVVIAIDGATELTVDSAGIKLPSSNELYINDVSVLGATTLGTGVTASSLTTVGNLTTLAASGTVRTTGQLFANSNVATSSTATGAVVVAGGVGISGGLQTGADIFIAGKPAATVDDATALSIALGG
jgi:hypothetical protein